MDKFRIDGFSDDSVINGIGSLFRRNDGSLWRINISTSPVKSERSYLTLSQSPIIVRQRVLNSKTEVSKKGYHKSFPIKDTREWQVAKVKDCPVIKHHRKADGEQYCFVFQIGDGTTVYLPQFELARALFFHDGYLSRTAMTPDVLQAEFDVMVNKDTGIATIDVMPSCTYKIDYYNEPSCRRLLSWILVDENARRSYESIGRYQLIEGKELGKYRVWDFKFDPPLLANTRFSVKGWFDPDLNAMFVHEIEGLADIPNDLPEKILFSHPNFTKDVIGKGNGGYAAGTVRPAEHNVDDEASANIDNKTVIIKPPSITLSFNKAVETIKIAQKNRISSNGKKDDEVPDKASKDVSTDEATTIGELPNADWDNIDDQTDDSHLYINKFESYFKMLELLKVEYGCEVISYSLRKLPKLPRCTKHLLVTDGNPRCLSVSYIKTDNSSYYLLEVDTSDTNKPLSTKVIEAFKVVKFESFIENVERSLLKGSLSWPKEYFDNFVGKSNHFGISHQQSGKNGSLTHEDINNWSKRFYQKLC
ncbi:Tn7-like element transposition protein TnsE [Flocculibacter collagenilyticus]|uniref:Tn7-like element transposition protein TnsE n=1 Tax=Flocculibacter collagenilyticus TaxID=2744479 RepID=UPI0018F7A713|nr:Tn7-like element transposition protein TnsE [Flocculibacter collagenilyticus]